MKALLWHRISIQKWSILIIISICALLSLLSIQYSIGSSIIIFPLIFSVSIVTNLYESDKKVHWGQFLNSLPLTKSTQLKADFLFCHSLTVLLFAILAPAYFMQMDEHNNFSNHFAMFFAYVSSSILFICIQFYTSVLDGVKRKRTVIMLTAVLLVFIINFPFHFYLSIIAITFIDILIPTLISLIISIFVFRKCLTLYEAKEVY